MEKLMKPAEYAKELGISRQAVYAKIKRGILTAKNVEGKLYIVIDNSTDETTVETTSTETVEQTKSTPVSQTAPKADNRDYKALLKAKNETISVLKGTVKDLKKSNKQISTTLKGEIDLLKDAFHEMRSLYVLQLEQKKTPEHDDAIDVVSEEEHVEEHVEVEIERWIGVKKFFKQYDITKEKQQAKILKRLTKAYKSGDERLMKVEEKLKMNKNKSYEDIIR